MNDFTAEELKAIYDVFEEHYGQVICGDWEAITGDLCEIHLIMYKCLKKLQPTETNK